MQSLSCKIRKEILYKNIVTSKDGKVEISNLEVGEYQLIETKAPSGYQIDKTPIKFSINDRSTNISKPKVLEKENKRIKNQTVLLCLRQEKLQINDMFSLDCFVLLVSFC